MIPPKAQIPARNTIIPFYVVAAFCFFLASLLCLVAAPAFSGHYFQPKILAITHLAVLGWGTMMIIGASNQLAPVITEQRLQSERLPLWVLILLTGGTGLLVVSFWRFRFGWYAYTGGTAILFALVLHAVNIYNTVRKAKDHIINNLMVAAHAWLLVTASIGLLLLINLRFPFFSQDHLQYLKVHAGIGMAGWFLQLVVGVSARLVPMFLLSRKERTNLLNITYYTLNLGLLLFFVNGMLFDVWLLTLASICSLVAGVCTYGAYIYSCYTSAMRKQLDNGMKQTFLALLLLAVPFLLLFTIILLTNNLPPNIATAYAFSFFGGFISTLIMGQTFKTLPFIVWMHTTSSEGLPELMPKDLFNEKWVRGQMILYLLGYGLFLTGLLTAQVFLLFAGSGIMTIAAAWYLVHVLAIIKKLKSNA